jgi:hypothetical protein
VILGQVAPGDEPRAWLARLRAALRDRFGGGST